MDYTFKVDSLYLKHTSKGFYFKPAVVVYGTKVINTVTKYTEYCMLLSYCMFVVPHNFSAPAIWNH